MGSGVSWRCRVAPAGWFPPFAASLGRLLPESRRVIPVVTHVTDPKSLFSRLMNNPRDLTTTRRDATVSTWRFYKPRHERHSRAYSGLKTVVAVCGAVGDVTSEKGKVAGESALGNRFGWVEVTVDVTGVRAIVRGICGVLLSLLSNTISIWHSW